MGCTGGGKGTSIVADNELVTAVVTWWRNAAVWPNGTRIFGDTNNDWRYFDDMLESAEVDGDAGFRHVSLQYYTGSPIDVHGFSSAALALVGSTLSADVCRCSATLSVSDAQWNFAEADDRAVSPKGGCKNEYVPSKGKGMGKKASDGASEVSSASSKRLSLVWIVLSVAASVILAAVAALLIRYRLKRSASASLSSKSAGGIISVDLTNPDSVGYAGVEFVDVDSEFWRRPSLSTDRVAEGDAKIDRLRSANSTDTVVVINEQQQLADNLATSFVVFPHQPDISADDPHGDAETAHNNSSNNTTVNVRRIDAHSALDDDDGNDRIADLRSVGRLRASACESGQQRKWWSRWISTNHGYEPDDVVVIAGPTIHPLPQVRSAWRQMSDV